MKALKTCVVGADDLSVDPEANPALYRKTVGGTLHRTERISRDSSARLADAGVQVCGLLAQLFWGGVQQAAHKSP